MKGKKFITLALTAIISTTSCSSLDFLKKEETICLDQEFFQKKWLKSDGVGNYYEDNLNSKTIIVRIDYEDKDKYTLGDCVKILPDKRFKDQPEVYKITREIN